MLSRAKSLLLNAALAVVLLAGAVAVAAETGMIVTERPPDAPSVVERPSPKIQVRGHVKGLYPGARKSMKVRVSNRLSQKVSLVSVKARVSDASPTCSRSNLSVTRFKGHKPIRAHSRTKVRTKVTMNETTPDACQGARFPIKFKARVTGKRP
ncbi:MAG: hypothetical protein QOI31_3143 [Solirubrobacterales bacterium]|jgi:hypothetical protein|nr:hypothetical protein [Solirubrobacterales bacterium]